MALVELTAEELKMLEAARKAAVSDAELLYNELQVQYSKSNTDITDQRRKACDKIDVLFYALRDAALKSNADPLPIVPTKVISRFDMRPIDFDKHVAPNLSFLARKVLGGRDVAADATKWLQLREQLRTLIENKPIMRAVLLTPDGQETSRWNYRGDYYITLELQGLGYTWGTAKQNTYYFHKSEPPYVELDPNTLSYNLCGNLSSAAERASRRMYERVDTVVKLVRLAVVNVKAAVARKIAAEEREAQGKRFGEALVKWAEMNNLVLEPRHGWDNDYRFAFSTETRKDVAVVRIHSGTVDADGMITEVVASATINARPLKRFALGDLIETVRKSI